MKVLIKILFLSTIIILLNCNCADITENDNLSIDTLVINKNREALTDDMKYLSELAINYTRKPKALGGGSNSFCGWYIPDSLKQTKNGKFNCNVISSDSLKLYGSGNVIGNDRKSPIQVEIDVSRSLGISTALIVN